MQDQLILLNESNQSSQISNKTQFFISKGNKLSLFFDFFVLVLVFIQFYIIPIETCFSFKLVNKSEVYRIFMIVTCALFVFQILIQFFTSFYQDGIEKTDRKLIFKNYLRKGYNGQLIWDALSLAGILFDIFLTSEQQSYQYFYILFYTKILFVINFDTYIKDLLQFNKKALNFYTVFRLFIIIINIANIIACIYNQISILSCNKYKTNYYKSVYSELKPYPYFEESKKFRCAYLGISNKSQISLWDTYLYSLYLSLNYLSTVAYGNIPAGTPCEVLFTIGVMLVGTVIFAYIVGEILQLVRTCNSGNELQLEKISTFLRLIRNENIQNELKEEIIMQIKLNLEDENQRDIQLEEEIINNLPFALKLQLYYQANLFFFKDLQWPVGKFSEDFLSALSFDVKELFFSKNDEIVIENDQTGLYYILKGEVKIEYNNIFYKKNIQPNILGSYQFITGRKLKEKVICEKPCKLLFIQRSIFQQKLQLELFTEDRVKKNNIKKSIFANIQKNQEQNL